MEKCETCKHYKVIAPKDRGFTFAKDNQNECDRLDIETDKIFIDSFRRTSVYVAPDFGCMLHAKK